MSTTGVMVQRHSVVRWPLRVVSPQGDEQQSDEREGAHGKGT